MPPNLPVAAPSQRRRWQLGQMTQSLADLILRPLLLPLLLLAGVAGTVIVGVNRNVSTAQQVTASQERLNLLTDIQKDVASLENGQRGYVITGQESFLQPYTQATADFQAHTEALRQRSTIALQQENLNRVVALMRLWQITSAQPEIRARRISLTSAADLVSTGQGKRQLEDLRTVLTEMQDREAERQKTAIDNNNAALQNVRLITLTGLLLGMGLMLYAALRAARTVQESVTFLSEGAQEIAAGRYDLRLPETRVRELDMLGGQFHRMAEAVQRREQEVEETTRALQNTNADLERSNRELERFAYVASHDLQEPLRTIGSYTELLGKRYKGQLDERADKYIDFTISATQRLKNLIQDLLAFSRVNRLGRAFGRVDTAELAQQVRAELDAKIEQAGASVEISPLPTVRGNTELLHHVFLNLIANAVKFRSPERPAKVRVWAERFNNGQGGQGWIYHVQDNGIGIEPMFFDKIFEVFQRLHGLGEYEGSGIGLAVTRSAIEQHGGKIWLSSVPNHGTTFHFILPDEAPQEYPNA